VPILLKFLRTLCGLGGATPPLTCANAPIYTLKRNLQNQVAVYEKANGTRMSVKMIVCFTDADVAKVDAVLKELDLRGEKSIVVIDARAGNKPSGSKA